MPFSESIFHESSSTVFIFKYVLFNQDYPFKNRFLHISLYFSITEQNPLLSYDPTLFSFSLYNNCIHFIYYLLSSITFYLSYNIYCEIFK